MGNYRVALIALMCLNSLCHILAQDHNKYLYAENLYKEKKYDKCLPILQEIIRANHAYPDSTLAAAYKLRGDLYLKEFDIKNTLSRYEKADEIYAKYPKQFVHQRIVLANKSGICYAQQDNLVMTAKYFQKEYDLAIQNYAADDLTVGKSTNNLAAVYLYLGDFEKSLDYFFKSLEIKKKFEADNPLTIANTYENISSIYGQINQMGEAERYLQMAGHLYQRDTVAAIETLFSYYLNTAGFYIENEQSKVALKELDKGEALSEDFKANKLSVLLHHKLYADAYFQLKQYEKSLTSYKQAEALIKKYDVGQKELSVMHTQMASIYAKQGDQDKAIQRLEIARAEILPLYGSTHKNYLNLLENQISILLEMGDVGRAEHLIKDFKKNFALRYEKQSSDLLFSNLKMAMLNMDLNCGLVRFKQDDSESNLDSALAIADSVVLYQDEVLSSISDKENKLYFFQNAFANFSTTVYLLLKKYKRNKDAHYLEAAFALSEKAKYYSLREARGVRYPFLETLVSKDLIEKEKSSKIELNQTISLYENKLDQKTDPEAMLELIGKVDSLKSLHRKAVNDLSEASIAFKDFLFEEKELDLAAAKSKLKSLNRSYVSYFLNENTLIDEHYVFVMSGESLTFQTLMIDEEELEETINALNSALDIEVDNLSNESQITSFQQPAISLYETLIAPLAIEKGKGIIVNGHQVLNSIPFGVLWNNKQKTYLLQDHAISYSFGMQTLLDAENLDYDVDLLSSAPDFSATANLELMPLENTGKEIQMINSILDVKNSVRVASKQAFQEKASSGKYNIMHLATHASANQQKGYQSYLAFGNSNEDLLYSREIYGLPIYSNLVVMSACETGGGELVKSQGVLGLTSAFASTAAQSIVASLWNVNDASSQQIMANFYKGLKSGQAKDEALRSAKMAYIASVPNSQRHPCYWAGFVQYGSTAPLDFKNGWTDVQRTGLALVGLLCMIALWYWRKNKAVSLA